MRAAVVLGAQRTAAARAAWSLAASAVASLPLRQQGHLQEKQGTFDPGTGCLSHRQSWGAGTEPDMGNGDDATWYLQKEPEKHDFISRSQFYPLAGLIRKHGLKLQQHFHIFYANCSRATLRSITILLPLVTHQAHF